MSGGKGLDLAVERLSSLNRLLCVGAGLIYRGGVLAVVVLVVITGVVVASRVGRLLGAESGNRALVRSVDQLRVAAVREQIAWEKVDAAVATAAKTARGHAEEFAGAELDKWNAELLGRLDRDFLPWYFSYWNQQVIGLKAMWQGAKYELAGYVTPADTPGPSRQMARDIQEEFASRVLRPESAQLFLEQLTRKTVDVYLADLREGLAVVQVTYKIPQAQWERYLADIAITTARTKGNREVPLSLKAVAGTSLGAGAVVATTLTRVAGRFEGRVASAAAEEAGARVAVGVGEKMAAEAGGKVAARVGGKFLGPVVAAAIIAWDVYDHHQTVSQNWPILRESLAEYLGLLKESLLHDPQTGIAGPIYEIEAGIVQRQGSGARAEGRGSGHDNNHG